MAKKELTISEFREIIKEEALKLKRRVVLENERRALENELKTLNEGMYEEGMYEEGLEEMEMEEGWFGPDKGEVEKFRQELSAEIDALLAKVPEGMEVQGSKDEIMQQAAESNFQGEPWLRQNKQKGSANYGKVYLGFSPKLTGLQKLATAAGGSLRGGHTFGSGTSNE
jgi:hypothetical protein